MSGFPYEQNKRPDLDRESCEDLETRSEEAEEWLPGTVGPQMEKFLDDETTDTWNALDATVDVISPDQSPHKVAGNSVRDRCRPAGPPVSKAGITGRRMKQTGGVNGDGQQYRRCTFSSRGRRFP